MRLISLILLVLLSACNKQPDMIAITGKTMGTSYLVKYIDIKNGPDSKKLKETIDRRLFEVNKYMSTYIPTSEISTFNKGPKDTWVTISEDFFTVLDHALGVARKTDGVFDPTIGPLVNLWGFGPDGKRKVPSKQSIDEALSKVGYNKVSLDPSGKKVKKDLKDVYIDLSASAKGYGVDVIAKLLEEHKLKDFMVEIGGEIITKGKKRNKDWRIAVEAPNPDSKGGRYQKVLNISGMAVATSGDYRNFFKENGKKYSHTIDFKTGKPVAHTLASVTVVDESSCMNADAWATALMALGPIKGLELAQKLNLAAYFVYKLDGQNDEAFVDKGTVKFNKLFK